MNCTISDCATCSSADVCGVCNTNFTLVATNNSCVPNCGINWCVDCSGNTCNTCLDNFVLFGTAACMQLCDIENCDTCAGTGLQQCETCATGYVQTTDKTGCVVCSVPNCVTCNIKGGCDVCQGNLEYQSGQCLTCEVDNCMTCSANNVCAQTGCFPGYSINPTPTGVSDQCIVCNNPCLTCFANGSCQTCALPYSQVTLTQGNSCFLCADPNCVTCSSNQAGACTQCRARYSLAAGACESNCATGCSSCVNSTFCNTCNSAYYYMGDNNTCVQCPNAPNCIQCNSSVPEMCLQCSPGYWTNSNGTCVACPAYCAQCTSATFCTQLLQPMGYVLVATSMTSNVVAACDPGCSTCSASNPQECTDCMSGYYLMSATFSYCLPCTFSSSCETCSTTNPGICLTCFPGFYLNSSSICVMCTFPCVACSGQNATQCSACAQGYVLTVSNNTCIQSNSSSLSNFGTVIENCANSVLTTATNGSNSLTCKLCDRGYALTTAGCAPCSQGCLVCNPNTLTSCTSCMTAYYLNTNNTCTACAANCMICSAFNGCMACANYYVLNQNFVCQMPCNAPCSTCSATNPSLCSGCIAGYSLVNGQCIASTSCNGQATCLACPFGSSVVAANSNLQFNQTCVNCTASSNCARCNVTNPAQCYSCLAGWYLNNTVCAACSTGCAVCLSARMCTMCSAGYVPVQVGSLGTTTVTAAFYKLVSCTPCTDNCATCIGSTSTCTSCVGGFTFKGGVCVSNFNFVISTTLGVTLAVFQNNYVSFINQIASAASVKAKDILVLSIVSGSVTVNMQVNAPGGQNSNAATTAQNNLNSLLSQGNTIANMGVTASSITTAGGSSSDDDNSGLSTQTIIILAVVIPVGTLRTYLFIQSSLLLS